MSDSPTSLPIVLRRPTADDMPFVLNAWKRTLRQFPEFRDVPNERFFPWIGARIERILTSPTTVILIAADEADPTVIHGFTVTSPSLNALHFVYVKQLLRRNGVARRLVEAAIPERPIRVVHDRLPQWFGSFGTLARRLRLVFDPTVLEVP